MVSAHSSFFPCFHHSSLTCHKEWVSECVLVIAKSVTHTTKQQSVKWFECALQFAYNLHQYFLSGPRGIQSNWKARNLRFAGGARYAIFMRTPLGKRNHGVKHFVLHLLQTRTNSNSMPCWLKSSAVTYHLWMLDTLVFLNPQCSSVRNMCLWTTLSRLMDPQKSEVS